MRIHRKHPVPRFVWAILVLIAAITLTAEAALALPRPEQAIVRVTMTRDDVPYEEPFEAALVETQLALRDHDGNLVSDMSIDAVEVEQEMANRNYLEFISGLIDKAVAFGRTRDEITAAMGHVRLYNETPDTEKLLAVKRLSRLIAQSQGKNVITWQTAEVLRNVVSRVENGEAGQDDTRFLAASIGESAAQGRDYFGRLSETVAMLSTGETHTILTGEEIRSLRAYAEKHELIP